MEGIGVELGPLDAPVLERDQRRVHYVDYLDTAALQAKYGDHANVGSIVDVDIVLMTTNCDSGH